MSSQRATHISRNLQLAILMSAVVLVIEIYGGIKAGSLALLSDAGHVFGDIFSLIITFVALRIASLPANTRRTFGYHRAEVFAALINGLTLLGLAFFIVYAAYGRLGTQPQVQGSLVTLIAFLGLLPNLWTVWQLRNETNLNIKSAFLHAASDAASSILVLISGLLITFSGIYILDPIISFLIALLIIISAGRLLKSAFVILFEGVPEHFQLEEVSQKLCGLKDVAGSHDLHLWTICSDVVHLTGHLVVRDQLTAKQANVISKNAVKLLGSYGIHHVTFQFETAETACEKAIKCEILH